MTTFHDQIVKNIECPVCGAQRGEECRDHFGTTTLTVEFAPAWSALARFGVHDGRMNPTGR